MNLTQEEQDAFVYGQITPAVVREHRRLEKIRAEKLQAKREEWKDRTRAFREEYADMCRRHGLWISGYEEIFVEPYPDVFDPLECLGEGGP